MKYICNYSILRFTPYPETGEFVNIGVVLFANSGDLVFKVNKRITRVTQFFNKMDKSIYLRAREEIKGELTRLSDFFAHHRQELSLLKNTFMYLVQPRETMMRFSEPGTIRSESLDKTLSDLFEHYVNHSFATKEYQEDALEKELGNLLKNFNLKQHYSRQKLGNDNYSASFPFVLMDKNRPAQAIKPIYLGHDEPSKLYEHGDLWIGKVKRLKAFKSLPDDTLFIAEAPFGNPSQKLKAAFDNVLCELSEVKGVRVLDSKTPESSIVLEIKRGIPSLG